MTVGEMNSLLEGCPDHGRIEVKSPSYGREWDDCAIESVRVVIEGRPKILQEDA